jgi:hypothetical protein
LKKKILSYIPTFVERVGGGRFESRVLAASAGTCAWISLPSLHYPNTLAKQHRTAIEKVEYAENSSHNCFGVHGQIG